MGRYNLTQAWVEREMGEAQEDIEQAQAELQRAQSRLAFAKAVYNKVWGTEYTQAVAVQEG